MAKYSRSALSMKESLTEISSQRAEQFLNTFYFQYGHRSIADLAHIPFAIERLSLLAAITLVDETRWDGQERSTRYQDFGESDGTRRSLSGGAARGLHGGGEGAVCGVRRAERGTCWTALKAAIPRPEAMKPESYERTLKARAFDVARYLLPLATNTSLGQIVNARTLESQVSRLLSSEFAEIRELGAKLRDGGDGAGVECAARGAGGDGRRRRRDRRKRRRRFCSDFMQPVRTAPTLVKYAERE